MAAPPSKQSVAARHYKSYLTPEFHRRFLHAFTVTTLASYGIAILQGRLDPFWSWFPFGRAGIRTLTLLIPTLFVYIIRVRQSHVGDRTPVTILQAVTLILRVAFFTWLSYAFSAIAFAEAYIWWADVPEMGAVTVGRSHEHSKINERPVYLRCMLALGMATVQTFFHIAYDYDKISLTASPVKTDISSPEWRYKALTVVGRILNRAGLRGILTVVLSTAIYFITPIRYLAWRATYTWNYMWVAKATGPGRFADSGIIDIMRRSIFQAILLVVLWETVNLAFNHFINKAPLKKGQPITSGSKDQNGTLLTGLKARKDATRSFAFWELSLITQTFDDRRKLIYDDYSHNAYKLISEVCLREVGDISKRIQASKPASPPAPTAPPVLESLPKISSKPVSTQNILNPNPPAEEHLNTLGYFAKQHGSSPQKSVLADPAQKIIAYGEQASANAAPKGTQGLLKDVFSPLIHAPYIGPYLRRSFAHVVKATVFGSPESRLYTVEHAIVSLSHLAARSLQEDKFGQVAPTIAETVRTLVMAMRDINGYVKTAQPHWTDVDFKEEDRKVPEIQGLSESLREGLERVLVAHAEFLGSEGLAPAEIREAKTLASAGNFGGEKKQQK